MTTIPNVLVVPTSIMEGMDPDFIIKNSELTFAGRYVPELKQKNVLYVLPRMYLPTEEGNPPQLSPWIWHIQSRRSTIQGFKMRIGNRFEMRRCPVIDDDSKVMTIIPVSEFGLQQITGPGYLEPLTLPQDAKSFDDTDESTPPASTPPPRTSQTRPAHLNV